MSSLKTSSNVPFSSFAIQNRTVDQIRTCRERIELAKANPEISNLLSRHGWDAARLDNGLALCQSAQESLLVCQASLEEQGRAQDEWARFFDAARQVFVEFRKASQPLVQDAVRRYELGLEGRVPQKPLEFAALASSSYKMASASKAYLASLKSCGHSAEILETGCASLEAFAAADFSNENAKAVAIDATIDWELTAARLQKWASEFYRNIKTALRDRPDLLRKLGL